MTHNYKELPSVLLSFNFLFAGRAPSSVSSTSTSKRCYGSNYRHKHHDHSHGKHESIPTNNDSTGPENINVSKAPSGWSWRINYHILPQVLG